MNKPSFLLYFIYKENYTTYIMVTIYVLKLKENKYYIGKTTNPKYRLEQHFIEGGSAWTKKYKPISLYELIPNKQDSDEQIITQEYMKKYGIENVRGGPWCKVSLTKSEKDMILKIIDSNSDKCYNCGSTEHFASQCPKKNINHNKITKNICERCGRTNHTEDECYAKIDINGNEINSSKCEEEIWECSKCGKQFDSYKGASYHERFYCKKVDKSKSDYSCKRCGRKGHTKNNCYAETHVKGYDLYY